MLFATNRVWSGAAWVDTWLYWGTCPSRLAADRPTLDLQAEALLSHFLPSTMFTWCDNKTPRGLHGECGTGPKIAVSKYFAAIRADRSTANHNIFLNKRPTNEFYPSNGSQISNTKSFGGWYRSKIRLRGKRLFAQNAANCGQVDAPIANSAPTNFKYSYLRWNTAKGQTDWCTRTALTNSLWKLQRSDWVGVPNEENPSGTVFSFFSRYIFAKCPNFFVRDCTCYLSKKLIGICDHMKWRIHLHHSRTHYRPKINIHNPLYNELKFIGDIVQSSSQSS